MPFPLLAPLIMGGASLVGGWLSGRNKQSSTPTIDPAFKPLQQMLIDRATKRLSMPSSLPEGFETGGISTINKTFDAGRQSLENVLTARGLGTSPVAGSAMGKFEGGRVGVVARFRRDLPVVERQMRQEDEEEVLRLLGLGRGMTYEGRGGGGAAGAAENLASMLGFLYGQGAFGGAGGGRTGAPTGAPGSGLVNSHLLRF